MELTQKEQREGHAAGDTLIDGGFGVHTHQPRRKGARIRLFSKRASAALIAATAAAITFFPVAATAAGGERQEQEEGGLLRAGNGPGPGANGPGPGCNIIPALASIGTKLDSPQVPPADLTTNPEPARPGPL